jgi:tetratricopeptide (TPR) repeat protein
MDPRAATLQRMLSNAALQQRRGEYEQAWRCLDDALTVAPESAAVYEAMGLLSMAQEEFEAAEQCFRRALERDPRRKVSAEGLGQATIEIKRREPVPPEVAMARAAAEHERERRERQIRFVAYLLPGLHQMWLFEFGRGVLFFLSAMGLWALTIYGVDGSARHLQFNPLFWVGLMLTGVWHVLAALDASRLSQALRDEQSQWL